jgi:predicted metal-dependent enzyme (double-stranded beta helix superfamily)
MHLADLRASIARLHMHAAHLPEAHVANRLAALVAAFAAVPAHQGLLELARPVGNYHRMRLSAADDPFQVVLVCWGPGQGSPIHDHAGTIGAVVALVGETIESRYRITARDGDRVRLAEDASAAIPAHAPSPILPGDHRQVHRMTNPSSAWAATVHAYLTPIARYHTYTPLDDGWHASHVTELWFDQHGAYRSGPHPVLAAV